MYIFQRRSPSGMAAICGTLLAVAVGSQAQEFPPFPEPAVGPFPDTQNMVLLSQLLPAEIGAVTPRSGVLLNDIWGWTSPAGERYALIGTGDGMSVVRVTQPRSPEFMGIMPTAEPEDFANLWGDVAVLNVGDEESYTSYAYYTTEATGVGISILELNQLDLMEPAPNSSYQIEPSAVFEKGGYQSAHNIYVNNDSGYAYVVGAELEGDETACDGQPFHPSRFNTLILDVRSNPLDPDIVTCLADHGEHDIYVVNYDGPDKDYRGREIAFVFDGRDKDADSRGGLREDDTPGERVGGTTEIWDVTDKDDVKIISSFTIPGLCFSHAGWTSSDQHEFLLVNDELDELRDAEDEDGFFRTEFCATDNPPELLSNPGVYVLNVKDLDNPVFQERFEVESPGDNDHNFLREGNRLYWAVYNAGTHVIRMRKQSGELKLEEIGRIDTEPRTPPAFNGQWGIYSFRRSGTIIASDIVNGLMVMRQAWGPLRPMTSTATAATARPALTAAQRAKRLEYYKARLR